MNWIDVGITAGTGAIAGGWAYITGRKKSNAEIEILKSQVAKLSVETDSEVIRSAKEIIAEWKELRGTYKEEITAHKAEIKELREKMKQNQKDCDETNKQLLLKIAELEVEIKEDKDLLRDLEQRIKQYENAS